MAAISTISQPSTVTLPTSGSHSASAQAVSVQAVSVKAASIQVKAQPNTAANTQTKKQEQAVTEQQVQQAIGEATLNFAGKNESIGFSYEKKLGQIFVQVKDNQTGEVIREIPSKDFIKHRIAMREMIGLLLDKQG